MFIIKQIRNTKKTILIGCLFLFFKVEAQVQSEQLFQKLLNAELYSANTDFDSPAIEYYQAYSNSINYLILESIGYDEYENRQEAILERFEALEITTTNSQFFEADIYFQSAMAALKAQKQLEFGWLFRQAFKQIEELLETNPNHVPSLKTMGMMEVLLGAIPKKYQWIVSLAGMEGSINTGLQKLQNVIASSMEHRNEAILIKSLLETYVLNNPSQGLKTLSNISVNGALIDLVKMTTLVKCHQSAEAIKFYEHSSSKTIPILYYLAAEAYLQKGNYIKAKEEYTRYLKHHKGLSNKLDSHFKLALIDKLTINETFSSYPHLDSANILSPKTAADKIAHELVKEFDKLNYRMLQMRYAIDGGFYEEALQLSKHVNIKTTKDSVEFIYRIARINHLQNNIESAKKGYITTIKIQNENWYFAPNACLQLGEIYTKANRVDSAYLYFNKVDNYKNYQYENSISTKAQAGINQLKDLLGDQ